MWSLETIVNLNEKASELKAEKKNPLEAFRLVGIQIPRTGDLANEDRRKNEGAV